MKEFIIRVVSYIFDRIVNNLVDRFLDFVIAILIFILVSYFTENIYIPSSKPNTIIISEFVGELFYPTSVISYRL